MADEPIDGLWNWAASRILDPALVRAALAGVLGRPVAELGGIGAQGALLCDVWQVGGDYPTIVDCYLAPGDVEEAAIAGAVAARLDADILFPDESLNPTRYVLAAAVGTFQRVHVDEVETDDGPERRHTRPCTGADPACAAAPERDAA
jgi:hypothetical protein